MKRLKYTAPAVAFLGLALAAAPAQAAFHLWQVKEIFSNADGTVQFIELFDSNSGEQVVGGKQLRTNSDGVIKTFTIPSDLVVPVGMNTVNKHMLIATPGFGSIAGAVAPNYELPDPNPPNTPFFNPNATSITITFLGSGDGVTFAGTLLPKDGFHSLTDLNATGFIPNNPTNLMVTDNSPSRFISGSGQIDLRPTVIVPTGDYNGDHQVDAADYTVWRDNEGTSVTPHGSGADGDGDGTIGPGDYDFWSLHFGETPGGPGSGAAAIVPEPAILSLAVPGLWALLLAAKRARAACARS